MASSAESEISALFINTRELLPLRTACAKLGNPQQATSMRTNNNTASGIIDGISKQDKNKTIDMQFYWLVYKIKQGQFKMYWVSKRKTLQIFTKHHPASHHRRLRYVYTHKEHSLSRYRGVFSCSPGATNLN